jgi:hypothetical protein
MGAGQTSLGWLVCFKGIAVGQSGQRFLDEKPSRKFVKQFTIRLERQGGSGANECFSGRTSGWCFSAADCSVAAAANAEKARNCKSAGSWSARAMLAALPIRNLPQWSNRPTSAV